MKLSPEDQRHLSERGITQSMLQEQLGRFAEGIPPVRVERPCIVDDGIRQLDAGQRARLCRRFREALDAGRITKMVPASGAATRMFQSLLGVLERNEFVTVNDLEAVGDRDAHVRDTLTFLQDIQRFPFYPDLVRFAAGRGAILDVELQGGDFRSLLTDLLYAEGLHAGGMNYAFLPKALLRFHRYGDRSRTALEEHLLEAVNYACDTKGVVRLHLTVSPEHEDLVRRRLEETAALYLPPGGRLELTFSHQHPHTDTVAVDRDNQPLRDEHGRLQFRPGGHGALLENLEELGGDVIFIKNIDNVAHERHLATTVEYKQALGGYLLEVQSAIFQRLEQLSQTEPDTSLLRDTLAFVETDLGLQVPEPIRNAADPEQLAWLISRLNRPLRVCGLVKNEGEPGGGPFWVRDATGLATLQLVELGQINAADSHQAEQLEAATHFSPVDLVCGVRDRRGRPFELSRFQDPDSGMISRKSLNGRELKALELPGLWNGGMAFWNTLFVEVPPITFNPVKTVLDLLRLPHQPHD